MWNFQQAEKYFIQADSIKDAIDMYNMASKWEEAYRVSVIMCYFMHAFSFLLSSLAIFGDFIHSEKIYCHKNHLKFIVITVFADLSFKIIIVKYCMMNFVCMCFICSWLQHV